MTVPVAFRVVVTLMLIMPVVVAAGDCSEGCKTQSRDGHFQVVAMPAEGEVVLRKHHDWIVSVRSADDSPVELDGLSVTGGMPGHGHGLPSQPKVVEYLGDGRYRFAGFLFNMHGDWILRFHMARRGVRDVADLMLTMDY